jgi:hypothetical protein
MRLTTSILNADGNRVNCKITESQEDHYTKVEVWVSGDRVGLLLYTIDPAFLHIRRMDNFFSGDNDNRNDATPPAKKFRHVGSLLFEYAFRKSVEAGKGGAIELEARNNSAAAYWVMGLRTKSFSKAALDNLLFQYSLNNSPKLKQEIQNHGWYPDLCQNAARKLAKEPTQVSFQEVIRYGFYATVNDEFEQFLAPGKHVSSDDCYRFYMQGVMCLPPDTIEALKQKFQTFIPIGSGLFFGYGSTTKVSYSSLQKLVQDTKLDLPNAVEIEAKISENSPRLPILLSKMGLEMMERNYVSGWYVGVYIHDLGDLKALISPNGLTAFEKGYIKSSDQLTQLPVGMLTKVLSDAGLEAFKRGDLFISDTGYSVLDKNKQTISLEALDRLIGPLPQSYQPPRSVVAVP